MVAVDVLGLPIHLPRRDDCRAGYRQARHQLLRLRIRAHRASLRLDLRRIPRTLHVLRWRLRAGYVSDGYLPVLCVQDDG